MKIIAAFWLALIVWTFGLDPEWLRLRAPVYQREAWAASFTYNGNDELDRYIFVGATGWNARTFAVATDNNPAECTMILDEAETGGIFVRELYRRGFTEIRCDGVRGIINPWEPPSNDTEYAVRLERE